VAARPLKQARMTIASRTATPSGGTPLGLYTLLGRRASEWFGIPRGGPRAYIRCISKSID